MAKWIDKLKERWGVKNGWQVLVILVVFACTGFSSLYLKKWIYSLLNWDSSLWSWWQHTLAILFIVLPLYQLLLLMYGWLFGQFAFFWNFEKRTFGRIGQLFSKKR